MACRLIDVYSYQHKQTRPEIPKKPLCLPEKLYIRLLLIKTAVTLCILAAALGIFFNSYRIYDLYDVGDPRSPAAAQRSPVQGIAKVVICMALYGAAIYAIKFSLKTIDAKTYARLQNPVHNPQGCRYQGKVLPISAPHYQLHLKYYKAFKTWTLPDDIEHSAEYT